MLPWVVRDCRRTIGDHPLSRHRHRVDRVEIGYTWYAASRQRSTSTPLQAPTVVPRVRCARLQVVGFRTDNFNFARSGPSRRWARRRTVCFGITGAPGRTVRDSVMYSILAGSGRMYGGIWCGG